MKKAEPAPAGRGSRDARGPREGGRDAGGRDGRPGAGRANLQAAVIWVAVMVSRVFRIAAPAWVMLLSVPSVMIEHAQLALEKLAAQAHGQSVTQLLEAWKARDAALVPSASELGGKASASVRQS